MLIGAKVSKAYRNISRYAREEAELPTTGRDSRRRVDRLEQNEFRFMCRRIVGNIPHRQRAAGEPPGGLHDRLQLIKKWTLQRDKETYGARSGSTFWRPRRGQSR
jgi:hypothetical protein